MRSEASFQTQLELLQSGQDSAAREVFELYVDRLTALAKKRLSPKLRRRVDPEDIVHSAFRSFFIGAQNAAYRLERSNDLWRILAGITLNKLQRVVEKQTAAKRNFHREAARSQSIVEFLSPVPTAADVVAATEQLYLVLGDLSTNELFVLTSSVQGMPIEDIAVSLKNSARSTQRLLAAARAKVERGLLAKSNPLPAVPTHKIDAQVPAAKLCFPDFTLIQLIGAGGMGKVYKATERATGRIVAIKALHKARQTDTRAVAQFLQESQILARLRHPNIVGVHGLGQFPGGGYFMVVDFVEGMDLQTLLGEGPISTKDALSIVIQVAHAVEHAHKNGVIHCDLTPANVLVGKDRKVTVTDFGFAYLVAGRNQSSRRAVGGTIGFIAPEVLEKGQPQSVAADIYGLGALLCTLCAGAPPNRCQKRLCAQLPQSLENIIAKCLSDAPTRRYASAAEFIHDVNGVVIGEV